MPRFFSDNAFVGAPLMPRFFFDNAFELSTLCDTPLVTMPSIADAEWGDAVTEIGSGLAEQWLSCECGNEMACQGSRYGGEDLEVIDASCHYALGPDGSVTSETICGDGRGIGLAPDYLSIGGSVSDPQCWSDAEAIAFRQPVDDDELQPLRALTDERRALVDTVRAADEHWFFPADRYSEHPNTPVSDLGVVVFGLDVIRPEAFPVAFGTLSAEDPQPNPDPNRIMVDDCGECATPGEANCYVWPEGVPRPEATP